MSARKSNYSSLEADLREAAEEAACLQRSPLPGDYYRSQEVSRGVTLSAVSEVGFSCIDYTEELWGEDLGTCRTTWPATPLDTSSQVRCSGQSPAAASSTPDSVCNRFLAPDEPPRVPADASFHLEATTLVVDGSAVEAGNLLLDFFEGEASAQVTKVNRRKFSFKVEASLQGFTCWIKVRCYQQDAGYAFEFQRCRGDSVAFNSLFRAASDCLRSRTAPQVQAAATLPAPSSWPEDVAADSTANLPAPLLEAAPPMEVPRRLQQPALVQGTGAAAKLPVRALLPCLGQHPESGMWLTAPCPPTPLEACAEVRCSRSSRLSAGAADSACERFAAAVDEPPRVPADASFHLEATTLILNGSPVEAANQLLEFFEEEPTTHITKVNRRKFSFKIEVSLQGLRCTFKVRGYSQDSKLLFEFSRLLGDSVAFNSIYRSASLHLLGSESSTVTSLVVPPPLDSSHINDVQTSLAPLLDIAQRAKDVKLCAEAAGGLAAAARNADADTVAQLCTPRACLVIRKLLRTEHFSVACPTTALLSSLGRHPKAGMWLAGQGLLQMVLERALSIATGKFLVDELAHIVKHVVASCGKQFSGLIVQELASSLRRTLEALEALQGSEDKRGSAWGHLQEALRRLMDHQEEVGLVRKKVS